MTSTTETLPRLLTLSGNAYREALAAAVQAAAQRRSFLIVDPPADATSVRAMVREAPAIAAIVQEHGALYWPSNPDFRYVSVRRTWLFVEAGIAEAIRGTASEPDQVQRSIETLLVRLWRSGAFVGSKAEEAFFVRRDGDHFLVGFAPLRPAEFLLVRAGP